MDIQKDKWEESFGRCENFIFYPKEEVVKFLNRFVRKRIDIDRFSDVLDFSKQVRGLDYGCGTGKQTVLMREFGLDAYGLDISQTAIEMAKKLAAHFGYEDMVDKFRVTDGLAIPFEDNFFDITISEAVLDSMSFELSKRIIKEIDRVTKRLVFISVISADCPEGHKGFAEEEILETQHEKGTIQCYYNQQKIHKLLAKTRFKIDWCRLITEESVMPKYKYGRYYIVLQKKAK